MRAPLLSLLVLAMSLLPAVPAAPLAATDPAAAVVLLEGDLVVPRAGAAAALVDGRVVVAGGAEMVCYCYQRDILAYDTRTGASTVEGTMDRLAETYAWTWTGERFLFFDGDLVVDLDPRSGATTEARLVAFYPQAVAWSGGRAWLVDYHGALASYDPVERTLTRHAARVPTGGYAAAMADGDGTLFVFGGGWDGSDVVWRLDAAADRFVDTGARLPSPMKFVTPVWMQDRMLLVGGTGPVAVSHAILAYDPASNKVVPVGALPHAYAFASPVLLEDRLLLLGGMCSLCVPTTVPQVRADPQGVLLDAMAGLSQTDDVWSVRLVEP